MASTSKVEKKVLLFGKTGDGKSTVANMLVSGNLDRPEFNMGDGMEGVTDEAVEAHGRGYHVVDTVGLGEETKSELENASQLIYDYLKRTKGKYSHIIFVKNSGRFDALDNVIWKTFLEVFKGAEKTFMVVLTKCMKPDEWYAQNKVKLHTTYGSSMRFVFVNFPPTDTRPPFEKYQAEDREESLERLEKMMDLAFVENHYRFEEPWFTKLDDLHLLERAQEIFSIVSDIFKVLKTPAYWRKLWQTLFA